MATYYIDNMGQIRYHTEYDTDDISIHSPLVILDIPHNTISYVGEEDKAPACMAPSDNRIWIRLRDHLCTEQCTYTLQRLTESPNDDFTADLCRYHSSSEVITLVVARAMRKQSLELYSGHLKKTDMPVIEPDTVVLPDDIANIAADYTARERATLLQGYIAGLSKTQPSQTGDALRTISTAVVQLIPKNNA